MFSFFVLVLFPPMFSNYNFLIITNHIHTQYTNTHTHKLSESNTWNRKLGIENSESNTRFDLVSCGNSGPTSVAVSSNGVLPNKSALFGNNNVNTSASIVTKTTTPTNNVVPNHGKPYCAPKPPGLKNGLSPLNNINSTTPNNGNNSRSNVARSQSVRTPRFVHAKSLITNTQKSLPHCSLDLFSLTIS